MSLGQLKQEAAGLSPTEQEELMSFLASIQLASDEEFRNELTRKIDDQDPNHWVDLEMAQAQGGA